MSFPAPISYALNLLTVYHFVIWLLLACVATVSQSEAGWSFDPLRLITALVLLGLAYLLLMPIVGQVFGDKFPFRQVWPAALLLGVLFSMAFTGLVALHEGMKDSTAMFISFAMFSVFLGAALNLFLYTLPRVVTAGSIIQLPRVSWGVAI